jgi:hypothetical protein
MATLLASADHPEQYLCPDVSRHGSSSDLAFPAAAHLSNVFKKDEEPSVSTRLDQCLVLDKRMQELVLENCQDASNGSEHGATVEAGVSDGKGKDTTVDATTSEPQAPATNSSHIVDENRIDTRAFLQVLFNTTAWKLSRVVHVRGVRYTLLPPPIPSPSTPLEEQGSYGQDPRTRFLFPSSCATPSIDIIADRLINDVGTSEALFRTFGTKGCPSGIIGRVAPYYSVDQTASHFGKLEKVMHGSEIVFLSLYEDCAVAYRQPRSADGVLGRPLDHYKAAHVVNVCFGALLSRFQVAEPWKSPSSYDAYLTLRDMGLFVSPAGSEIHLVADEVQGLDCPWLHQNPVHARLMRRLLRVIASRTMQYSSTSENVRGFVECLVNFVASRDGSSNFIGNPARILLEWTRIVFQQCWDNEEIFCWTSDVGCAIEFMNILCKSPPTLGGWIAES